MNMFEQVKPQDIEKRSFEIISEELGTKTFDLLQEPIIKRAIHTSADFEYADNLYFSQDVVKKAIKAIKRGAHIVTDTNMGKAGVNKKVLGQFGGEVHCFMADEDVAKRALEEGTTRAVASMKKTAQLKGALIIAVGNAPTALIQLKEMCDRGEIAPELVIAVPVGFVNVVEAKALFVDCEIPAIVARGRKGGSNIAAAICNALIYMARDSEKYGL